MYTMSNACYKRKRHALLSSARMMSLASRRLTLAPAWTQCWPWTVRSSTKRGQRSISIITASRASMADSETRDDWAMRATTSSSRAWRRRTACAADDEGDGGASGEKILLRQRV